MQRTTEIFVGTILFMLFFGYLRNIILNYEINSKTILINTFLFFLWYSLTISISDFLNNSV